MKSHGVLVVGKIWHKLVLKMLGWLVCWLVGWLFGWVGGGGEHLINGNPCRPGRYDQWVLDKIVCQECNFYKIFWLENETFYRTQ